MIYIAIRHYEPSDDFPLGFQHHDIRTLATTRAECESKVARSLEWSPNWSKANPVVRISRFFLVEDIGTGKPYKGAEDDS